MTTLVSRDRSAGTSKFRRFVPGLCAAAIAFLPVMALAHPGPPFSSQALVFF